MAAGCTRTSLCNGLMPAGLAAAWQSGDWRWIIGALSMLAKWPFTLLAIMPTNNRLNAIAALRNRG